MKNKISGYLVKNKDDCCFIENDNIISPYRKFSSSNLKEGYLSYHISTSIFSILCNIELLKSHTKDTIIIEVDISTTSIDIDHTLCFYTKKSFTKLNEITYEVFFNYIKLNTDKLIEWIVEIIKVYDTNTIFNYNLLILFSNLYSMNIFREYIKDIAKNNTYTFSNDLSRFINLQNNINKGDY